MSFQIELGVRVTMLGCDGLPEPERKRLLESHLDDVMAELMGYEDAIDPDLAVTFSEGDVTFFLIVDEPNEAAALNKAKVLVQAAITGAGGFTKDWWNVAYDEPTVRRHLTSA